MSTAITPESYAEKAARLTSNWQSGSGPLRLEKSTISNLFRYQPRGAAARRLSLGEFNHVLAIDKAAGTVEVEGLTTYETVVRYCLEHGFLPLVAPELKHITVGGATVGIGIESTCYRYGFVHDGLREADVLLPGGTIVTARADNEHADLFDALPNSYGTLGYILRAKIALHRAGPYVHLHVEQFRNVEAYLEAMRVATKSPDLQFVEGLFFEDNRFFLMTGRFVDKVPYCDDIVRRSVFYRLVEKRRDIYLNTFDYIFRYDPDWFWNIPETGAYNLFRRYAPSRFRNSAFYTKYVAAKRKALASLGIRDDRTEPLIQDWEVPWRHGAELIRFAIDNVDLGGRPWAAVPILAPRQPTLYPITPNELYFNLGCYCQVQRPDGMAPYHYTKILDDKCFELGGIKMLYSSTFLSETAFDALYNGGAYKKLKAKYDPAGNAQTLYKKVALAPRA
jgi:FAD/FMN-containing dehydrogenase